MVFLLITEGYAGGCTPTTSPTCATAIPLVMNGACVNGTTCGGGVPIATTCGTNTQATWYSFTATSTNHTVFIDGLTTSGCDIISSVFSGACGSLTQVACLQNGAMDDTYNLTGLTVGATYFIQMAYAPGGFCGNGGFFTFCVEVDGAGGGPSCTDNDACADDVPITLNAPGGAAACITDCNTGAATGPDFAGNNCYDLPNETVWYSFTTGATNNIDIDLTSAVMSNPEFSVFTTADCNTFTIIECVEGAGGSASSTGLVVAPSTTYYIAVSDATGDDGNFDLCITQNAIVASCVDNDDCTTPAPLTLNATGAAAACVTDCNTGAAVGPDFVGNNCYDFPNETVWYSITTAADVELLNISLTSADMSNPEFTLFTNSCGPYTIVDCVEGTGGSASAAINVSASTTYLIAVSDASGDEGTFDLCVSQFANTNPCNTDNTLAVTATSMGSPLAGPYQPGEVVTFCYTINTFMTSTTNCNYLQGIVPTFGDCWAPTSFNAQGMPTVTVPLATEGVVGNVVAGNNPCENTAAGTWSWYPAGSVDYNLNSPNPLGLAAGDDVGAGWFFVTNYDSYEVENNGLWVCPNGNLDPDDNYGDNSFPGCTDLSGWQVCFQLTANSLIDCQAGETDCSVQIKTFADGEIGVWQNIGCLLDLPTTHTATLNCIVLLQTGLEEFTGKNHNDKNLLTWTVAANAVGLVDYFLIEKSVDGINWTTLGSVESVNGTVKYDLTDNNPYNPVTYYRLQMVDFSGTGYLSSTIAIASSYNPGAGLASDIQPNPVKNEAFFVYTGNNLNEPIEIKIINVIGQTMSNQVLPVNDFNQKFSIETSNLSDGVYYITISQGSLQTTKRICVIR